MNETDLRTHSSRSGAGQSLIRGMPVPTPSASSSAPTVSPSARARKWAEGVQQLIASRQFDAAEQLILARLKEDQDNADAYYFYGVVQYQQGKLGPTLQFLKKALMLDPRHTDAAVCLSVLYNDIGKYDEAKQVFDQANQSVAQKQMGSDPGVDRKFAVKHQELGDLYFRYRRFEEAIEEYGKALMLDPTVLDVRIRRAKSFAKKGFLTRAMQELQQLKAEHPEFLPGRIQIGLLHYSQGNLLDAELEWETVLANAPGNREVQAYLRMAQKSRDRA